MTRNQCHLVPLLPVGICLPKRVLIDRNGHLARVLLRANVSRGGIVGKTSQAVMQIEQV